jgi:hypothetical protein
MFRRGFLSIIRSLVLYTKQKVCHRGYADCLLAGSWSFKTCTTYTYCCIRVYSIRLLMMDRKPVRNMWISIPKINLRNSASGWFCYKNISRCTVTRHDARSHVTMHGHMSRCTVLWMSNIFLHVNFSPKWSCFNFCKNILISLVDQQRVFCGFP